MNNRPYLAEAQTVYNENLFNTVPAQFGNSNLLINHGQQRKILDTATTSIAGQQHPQQLFNHGVTNLQNSQYPTQVTGQRQVFPDGVTYTFCPQAQNYALKNFTDMNYYNGNNSNANPAYQQQLTLEQQIALNQLQKHALESLLLHEQFRENPFKLQFHKDGQTNTENLYKDFCKCTSKNTLLRTLGDNNTLPKATSEQPKPEQLFPENVKRKQLRIKSSPNSEDKSIQFSPQQETIETQVDTIVSCTCKEKECARTDTQTETKKVTFDEPNTPNDTRKYRRRIAPTRRHVDEDSSDSSCDRSSSSKSSEEEN